MRIEALAAHRTVTLSYLGYALMLAIGLIHDLAAVLDHVVWQQAEAGQFADGWRDVSYALMHFVRYGAGMSTVFALIAFALACLPSGKASPTVSSHRAYLRRCGAFALSFCVLLSLTNQPLVYIAVEIGAAVVFAWSAGILAAGWRAHAAGATVGSPPAWRLALLANVLAVAAVIAVLIDLTLEGGRLISG
ncbi:MAG: hypothetical protein GEU89_18300 [Kiloniellaceae bacterium]|nr:hypothetical protein [Kiloniellaceae bacterium]